MYQITCYIIPAVVVFLCSNIGLTTEQSCEDLWSPSDFPFYFFNTSFVSNTSCLFVHTFATSSDKIKVVIDNRHANTPSFVIRYATAYSNHSTELVSSSRTVYIDNLPPYTTYAVQVKQANVISGLLFCDTLDAVPVANPVTRITWVGNRALRVEWDELTRAQARGLVIEYRVFSRYAGQTAVQMESVFPPDRFLLMTHLLPNTEYEVYVLASTRAGFPMEQASAWWWVSAKTTNSNAVRDGVDSAPKNISTDCSEDFFKCRNAQCIFLRYRCDGFKDCTDGSDEENCEFTCHNALKCLNGQCINRALLCIQRCRDESDREICHIEYKGQARPLLPVAIVTTSPSTQVVHAINVTMYFVAAAVGIIVIVAALLCRLSMRHAWAHRYLYRGASAPVPLCPLWPLQPGGRPRRHHHRPVSLSIDLRVTSPRENLEASSALMPPPPPYTEETVVPLRGDSPPPAYSTLDRNITRATTAV